MKNITQENLKTCIFLAGEEFTKIIHETLGDDVTVEYRQRRRSEMRP